MAGANLKLYTEPCMTADDSLVAWLALRLSGVAFQHRVVTSDMRVRDQHVEPPLPRLEADGQSILTSAAIVSLLAEHHPEFWPRDWRTRAEAKAVAAEAFSSFRNLKTYLPMAVAERFSPAGRVIQRCDLELMRLQDMWRLQRSRHGGKGPFLFGEIGFVDAFQAPLAARCVTYGLPLAEDTEAYVETVMDWPQMAVWLQRSSGSTVGDEVDYPGEVLNLDKPPTTTAAPAKESVLASLIQARSQPAAHAAAPAAEIKPDDDKTEPKPVAEVAADPPEPPRDARPALDASEPVPGDIIETVEERSARELLRSTFGGGPSRTTRRPFQPPPEPAVSPAAAVPSAPTAPPPQRRAPTPAPATSPSPLHSTPPPPSAPAVQASAEKPATPAPEASPSVPAVTEKAPAAPAKEPEAAQSEEASRRSRISGIKPIGGEIRRRR